MQPARNRRWKARLYVTNGYDPHHKLVTGDYVLGTPFEAKFVVSGGQVKAYGEVQISA